MPAKHSDFTSLPSTIASLFSDPVGFVRSLLPVRAADIIAVPDSYRPLDGDLKRKLTKLPETQRAETDDALAEIVANAAQLRADLGPFAPAADLSTQIHTRFQSARAATRRAEALARYCTDQDDLANHDAMTLVLQVQGDLARAADRNPAITARYPQLFGLAEQRSAAVSNGMANAKANEAAIAAAKNPPADAKQPATDSNQTHTVQSVLAALKSA